MTVTQNQVVPFSYQGSQVRTVQIDGEPFFTGKDICIALGLVDHNKTMSRLDPDERRGCAISTPNGLQEMTVISESGLYHLMFSSKVPGAKAFRKWVTSEVLPTLRKTGHYEVQPVVAAGKQLTLFGVEPVADFRMRELYVDVALQSRPGSKLAQFLRMVKPLVIGGKGGGGL
jgi:prophage antirepressor-like protein